jgi:hypothetical protein
MDPMDPFPQYPIDASIGPHGTSYPHHPPPPPATNPVYIPHRHSQNPTVNSAASHGGIPWNGDALFRESPPTNNGVTLSQQHPVMYRTSPYFHQANNGSVPLHAGHAAAYSSHTLAGYAGYPQQNNVSLPPLRQNNVMGAASALASNINNHINTQRMINGSSSNIRSFTGGRAAAASTAQKISNAHQMHISSAQPTTAALGNPNVNTAAAPSNPSTGAQSTASLGGGKSSLQPTITYPTQKTTRPATLPLPENEPESPPLPPMLKKDSMKLHHHPDLPFLVTHWVDHYAASSLAASENKTMSGGERNQSEEGKKQEALLRLERAAKDMAWAFETLGAFGNSTRVPVSINNGDLCRPTTYTDLKRKYAPLLSNGFASIVDNGNESSKVALLDSIVAAGSSASNEATKSVLETVMPKSLLEAANEGTVPTSTAGNSGDSNTNRTTSGLGVGRRVGDSTRNVEDESLECLIPINESTGSAFQNPVLMGGLSSHATKNTDYFSGTSEALVMTLGSNLEDVTKKAAEASRKYLSIRSKMSEEIGEFQKTRAAMQSAMARANVGGSALASDDATSDLDQSRVIAQLERRLGEMHLKISTVKKEAAEAKQEADEAYQKLSSVQGRYSDPFQISGKGQFSTLCLGETKVSNPTMMRSGCLTQVNRNKNFVLPRIITQQYQGRQRPSSFAHTQLSILKSRLSHAVTINCHLVYPIYCLKFDKTGKYFITGADDQLVKLFYLGAGPKHGERPAGKRFSYGANMRGAVLVCTLRGHAGVVTDLDVSVDNALLATASADGDVRVWGLRDGCPVAILRGHKDGANMVSLIHYFCFVSTCRDVFTMLFSCYSL